jgi:hypothetical protein
MTTGATVARVARPRGELNEQQSKRLWRSGRRATEAQAEFRADVVSVLVEGASFAEVSKATGLSTNTLQRWKREAHYWPSENEEAMTTSDSTTLEALRAAINHDLSPSLPLAHWASDPLPSCPNFAHVNADFLLELIAEAKAIRAVLGEPL